jgi:hypothetical protein
MTRASVVRPLRRKVKSIVEALVTVGHKKLKQDGVFLVPGFAKFLHDAHRRRPAVNTGRVAVAI